MNRRWWGAAPAALALIGMLALGGGAGAQTSTVDEDDLGLVAEIHQGSCAQMATDVAFGLGSLTRTGKGTSESTSNTAGGLASLGSGVVGATDAAPVWTTRETIDAAPADLFDSSQPYALAVGEQGPSGSVAACGDLGGVVANGQLAVALLPAQTTDAGILAGVAVFDAPTLRLVPEATGTAADATETAQAGGGQQTRVTVYVFRLAAASAATPTVEATSTPTPTNTPTVEPSPTVEVTATSGTVEATSAATGTAEATTTATEAATEEPTSTPTA